MTDAERAAAYFAEHPRASERQACRDLGMTRHAMTKALGRYVPQGGPVTVPRGEQPPLDRELRLDNPSALVLSDLHCPYHHAAMLERALALRAKVYPEVDTLIIAGDLFDFAGLSRHPQDQREAAVTDELQVAGRVLRALLAPFARAVVMPGNHDERLAKKLEAHIPMRFLIDGCLGSDRPACQVVTTEYDYVYVEHDDPERRWVIGHPSHYSGLGGRTPASIADLEQRNVMTAHNHVIGLSQSPSGKYVGIDIGHCTDPSQHLYVKRRLTKYPRWSAGFAFLVNGYAHPYYERFSNWGALLG